jgi:hypothetical protein
MSWQDLITVAHHLLRIPRHVGFLDGLACLHGDLVRALDANPDSALLALLCPGAQASQPHSATHAVTSAVVATLAARSIIGWTADEHHSAGLAALTMNMGMATLQDELVSQRQAPTDAQRVVMETHARASARLLAEAGVTDAAWLEAVCHHHDATCGSLAARSKGLQLARLLQRTELFVSQLRPPQPGRAAVSPAQAAQRVCVGEDGLPDEAGMQLMRALGMFPPGTVLRLIGGETAVVVRRGMLANMPMVAMVADAQGQRCTPELLAGGRSGVACALAPQDIPVAIELEPLLALATPRPPSPDGRD